MQEEDLQEGNQLAGPEIHKVKKTSSNVVPQEEEEADLVQANQDVGLEDHHDHSLVRSLSHSDCFNNLRFL